MKTQASSAIHPSSRGPSRRAFSRQHQPDCLDPPDNRDLEVRVLGPVDVAGHVYPVRGESRAKEIVVFLALARNRAASRDRICGQLGTVSGHPMAYSYLRMVCTRARVYLGSADDGRSRLRYERGAYTLHLDVGLDWDRFQELVARGKAAGTDGVADLRAALDLVRGEPLQDCGYRWVDLALVRYMRSCIVDAAECLAARTDDPVLAGWAACRGVLADPYAEQLYRALMRSSHAAGYARGLYEAYDMCVEALGGLGLPPDDQTEALFADLTGGRVLTRRPVGGAAARRRS